jgi:hypothetical protein
VQTVDAVRADYRGACVASIVPRILRREPAPWLPDLVLDARVVVLLVLDGLGWDAVQGFPALLPILNSMTGGAITTVVPSTTAAALTSITTGLSPAEHGVVGFRVAVDGDVLNVLGWQMARAKRAPDPFTIQRHAPFLGRPITVVTSSSFRNSGFTRVHLRDTEFVGFRAESTLVEHLRNLTRGEATFVYTYYPGIDEVAHEFGLHDGYYTAELAATDRLVGEVLDALPADAALVVTADHGQVHLDPESWLPLGDVEPFVAFGSGDGRFRYLHAKKGAADDLAAAAREKFGTQAWVLSRLELLDGGWLGPDPAPSTRRRVGDVVLAARDDVAFIDPAMPRELGLRSAHGSVTATEMLVPCLAARGGAARSPIG